MRRIYHLEFCLHIQLLETHLTLTSRCISSPLSLSLLETAAWPKALPSCNSTWPESSHGSPFPPPHLLSDSPHPPLSPPPPPPPPTIGAADQIFHLVLLQLWIRSALSIFSISFFLFFSTCLSLYPGPSRFSLPFFISFFGFPPYLCICFFYLSFLFRLLDPFSCFYTIFIFFSFFALSTPFPLAISINFFLKGFYFHQPVAVNFS